MDITTARDHGYQPGDMIEITTSDTRRWKRFWHWITFRDPPVKKERVKVMSVTSNAIITVGQ